MLDSFYVDDLVSGDRLAEETIDLYEKAMTRMAMGGFTLRKWLTNDANVRKRIQDRDGGKEIAGKITRLDDVETYAKSNLGVREEGHYEKLSSMSVGMLSLDKPLRKAMGCDNVENTSCQPGKPCK